MHMHYEHYSNDMTCACMVGFDVRLSASITYLTGREQEELAELLSNWTSPPPHKKPQSLPRLSRH